MRLIADTHVHIYPCYNIQRALDSLRANLSRLDGQAVYLAFMAERSDCHYYEEFKANTTGLFNSELKIRCLENALHFQEPGHPDLYLFPGRQIITQEKIEILSLTVDLKVEDGLAAQKVIDLIRQNGGLPVLSWAPGKWFFKRKQVVDKLLASNKPGSLLLGDTSLRPTCWCQPLLMKKAARMGFTIVSGSDPLPFTGEEQVMGQYGVSIDCDFDEQDPVGSIRSLLVQPRLKLPLVGKRGDLFTTLRRLFKNARSKTKNGLQGQT
jgi:hypothetical protein